MKAKIVFVLNTLGGGGIARVVTTLANQIAMQGSYEVYLLVMHKRKRLYEVHDEVKVIEHSAERNQIGKARYILNSVLFIRRSVRQIGTCTVVANGEWLNSFVYLSLMGLGRKVFFADHSNPERAHQSPFAWVDRLVYPRVNGVLVLSEAAKRKVREQYGQHRVLKLDNPVLFPELLNTPRKPVVLCMGRLSPEKGQDILIKAFARTKNDWKLWFLGDGPFREELELLVKKEGIEERVVFLGMQQDTAHYLNQAGLYVMPSLTENFPMALIEAMSLGLPCIASDCMQWRGSADFLQHNINGLKVPVSDYEALAAAIDLLVEDEKLRDYFGVKAKEIRLQFDLDKTVNHFIEYII